MVSLDQREVICQVLFCLCTVAQPVAEAIFLNINQNTNRQRDTSQAMKVKGGLGACQKKKCKFVCVCVCVCVCVRVCVRVGACEGGRIRVLRAGDVEETACMLEHHSGTAWQML